MTIILGLLALSILVLFHEVGHFIFAKIFHVRVDSFSLGMGPVLLHKKIGKTDYRLSLFPIGGYCGLSGENDFQKAVEQKLTYIKAEAGTFYGVHPAKRLLIAIGGPLFNFILALVFFSLVQAIGFSYYSYTNQIKIAAQSNVTVAKDAGLKDGDYITQIDSQKIQNFSDIYQAICVNPNTQVKIKVNRAGEELEFCLVPQLDKETGTGLIGVTSMNDTPILFKKKANGIFQAFILGAKECFGIVVLTFKSAKILFQGIKLQNAVAGPIRITSLLGESVKSGIVSFFEIAGLISMSLAIMNLLPIPVLDGSIVLFSFFEVVSRKKIHPKFLYYIQFVGLAMIGFLMFLSIFCDIAHYLGI